MPALWRQSRTESLPVRDSIQRCWLVRYRLRRQKAGSRHRRNWRLDIGKIEAKDSGSKDSKDSKDTKDTKESKASTPEKKSEKKKSQN